MISQVANLLGKLLSEQVAPLLKREGYRRSGQLFQREADESITVIGYQRSVRETGCDRFTVNLGIASKRLLDFEDRRTSARMPTERCHWQLRLGRLLDPPRDAWWEICDHADLDKVGQEQVNLLGLRALPTLGQMASDAALREAWLQGKAAGLTELQRLMYLSVLLDQPGLRDKQRKIIEELRAFGEKKGLTPTVNDHLERLAARST